MHPVLVTALENIANGWVDLSQVTGTTQQQRVTARFLLDSTGE